jgi:hypothetical protein
MARRKISTRLRGRSLHRRNCQLATSPSTDGRGAGAWPGEWVEMQDVETTRECECIILTRCNGGDKAVPMHAIALTSTPPGVLFVICSARAYGMVLGSASAKWKSVGSPSVH